MYHIQYETNGEWQVHQSGGFNVPGQPITFETILHAITAARRIFRKEFKWRIVTKDGTVVWEQGWSDFD